MGPCFIEVRLAERERNSVDPAQYMPGEPMNVVVTVEVDEPTTCDGLELVCRTRGTGKGFRPNIEDWRKQLFEGQWPVGTHRYEFQVAAPAYPPTYSGDWLQCNWWLEAKADVQRGKAPEDKERFILRTPPRSVLVLPDPQTASDRGHTEQHDADVRTKARSGKQLILLGAVGVSALAAGLVVTYATDAPVDVSMGLVKVGVMALLFVAVMFGRRWFKGRSNTPPPVELAMALRYVADGGGYRDAPAGESIHCTIYTDPELTVQAVAAKLEVAQFSEWIETSQTSSATTETFRSVRNRTKAELTATDTPGEWQGLLPLPDQPWVSSIEDAGGHGLIWEVSFAVTHSGNQLPATPTIQRIKVRPGPSPT